MNYKDLPVYIRKEDKDSASAYKPVIVYDPPGDYNGLLFSNLSEVSGSSIQYVASPFTRLTGNASNWAELFTPKIKVSTSDVKDVQVFLPKFRSLRFYNVSNNQQSTDPDFDKTFYAFSYDETDSTINYVAANNGAYIYSIQWFQNTDTYAYNIYNTATSVLQGTVATGNGNNFYSEWKLSGTNDGAGVYCSGTPVSGLDIASAINDPTGLKFYYVYNDGDTLIRNTINDSDIASGILYAGLVDGGAGLVYPHTKSFLGKAFPYIAASNISVNYQTQNNGKRLLGQNIDQDDQFNHGAALQAKVSFNSYLNTDSVSALTTILDSTGNNTYTIKFGNSYFSGCNLNSYSVSIEPFKPVMLSVDYNVYNAPKENLNYE